MEGRLRIHVGDEPGHGGDDRARRVHHAVRSGLATVEPPLHTVRLWNEYLCCASATRTLEEHSACPHAFWTGRLASTC